MSVAADIEALLAQVSTAPPVFLAQPVPGLPFADGVRCGNLLFLSGQIGIDETGRLAEGLTAQVDTAMRNLRSALQRAGGDLEHVVKCTIMLKDIGRWADFNEAYLRHFDNDRLPARSAFGGVGLAFDAEFEIDCIAWLPADAVPGVVA